MKDILIFRFLMEEDACPSPHGPPYVYINLTI